MRTVLCGNGGSFTPWVYLYPVGVLCIFSAVAELFWIAVFLYHLQPSAYELSGSQTGGLAALNRILSWDWGMFSSYRNQHMFIEYSYHLIFKKIYEREFIMCL